MFAGKSFYNAYNMSRYAIDLGSLRYLADGTLRISDLLFNFACTRGYTFFGSSVSGKLGIGVCLVVLLWLILHVVV